MIGVPGWRMPIRDRVVHAIKEQCSKESKLRSIILGACGVMAAMALAASSDAGLAFDGFSVASDSGPSAPGAPGQSAAEAWGSSVFASGSTRTLAAYYGGQVAVSNGSAQFSFGQFGLGQLDYNAAAGTSVDFSNTVFSVTLGGFTSIPSVTLSLAVFSSATDRKQFDITVSNWTQSNTTFTFNINDVATYGAGSLNTAAIKRVTLAAWGSQASFAVTGFTYAPAPGAAALIGMAGMTGIARGRRRNASR